jgi:hypothetical protein
MFKIGDKVRIKLASDSPSWSASVRECCRVRTILTIQRTEENDHNERQKCFMPDGWFLYAEDVQSATKPTIIITED